MPNFCHIWWFLKVERTEGAVKLWKIIEYGKNLAKYEEKICSAYLLEPFLADSSDTQISDFGYTRFTIIDSFYFLDFFPIFSILWYTFACSQKCDLACASEFYMAENYFVLFNWQNCFFNRNATLRLEIINLLSLLEALKLAL